MTPRRESLAVGRWKHVSKNLWLPRAGVLARRAFLQRASALGGVPWIVARVACAGVGAAAPNERITLGLIGVGAMGQGHLRCFLGYPEAQVVAVCDVDRWRREHGQQLAETEYAAQRGVGRFRACQAYRDLRELLLRDDIDAVVIATGDRWHALATVLAAQAGKDIYCEKPISLTVRECQAMVQAVRRFGRVFQSGLQQRSDPVFRLACELVRSGCLGEMRVVYVAFPGTVGDVDLPAEPVPEGLDWDLWLGPAPWRPYNHRFHPYGPPHGVVPWHFCRDFGGGNLTSNAVHAFDVVQWALGMDQSGPVEIIPPETGQVPDLTFRYANGVVLQVVNWSLDPNRHWVPKGWDVRTTLESFGALYVGQHGWVHVGRSGFLRTYPPELPRQFAGLSGRTGTIRNHHEDWLNAIRTRRQPVCDVAIGARSTTVSHLGCIAHWTRRALRWDPVREEFPGVDESNRNLGRAMREPWTL